MQVREAKHIKLAAYVRLVLKAKRRASAYDHDRLEQQQIAKGKIA